MYIENLTVRNFRNYSNLSLDFSSGINFIIGQNGVGKTNIIEAISIVSNLKSFRNVADAEIIKWGESSYYCSSTVKGGDYNRYEVGCAFITDRLRKRVKIDNIEIKRAADYYGSLLTVVFSPSDLKIIEGPPEDRRKFFDGLISKVDNDYFRELINFKRILVSRNRILKDLREKRSRIFEDVEVWDIMFAEKASSIVKKRRSFIEEFYQTFEDSFGSMSFDEESPLITYRSSLNSDESDSILEELIEMREVDVKRGSTCIGPQRDDYVFSNRRKNLFGNYASQGQKRIAAISLRLAEIDIIEKKNGHRVVILVDDILPELDEIRREKVFDFFRAENQVIFSMVNMDNTFGDQMRDQKSFAVEHSGRVREL